MTSLKTRGLQTAVRFALFRACSSAERTDLHDVMITSLMQGLHIATIPALRYDSANRDYRDRSQNEIVTILRELNRILTIVMIVDIF